MLLFCIKQSQKVIRDRIIPCTIELDIVHLQPTIWFYLFSCGWKHRPKTVIPLYHVDLSYVICYRYHTKHPQFYLKFSIYIFFKCILKLCQIMRRDQPT